MERLIDLMLVFILFLAFTLYNTYEYNSYYDSNGNRLPNEAVRALVRSQYVYIGKEDSILIVKHFKR